MQTYSTLIWAGDISKIMIIINKFEIFFIKYINPLYEQPFTIYGIFTN